MLTHSPEQHNGQITNHKRNQFTLFGSFSKQLARHELKRDISSFLMTTLAGEFKEHIYHNDF